MDTINERFRNLRKACNKNQEEWGNILGITRPGVSDIESGRRNVTDKHVKLLCVKPINGKYINETWLQTGEGEMFKERSPSDEIGYYVEDLLEYEGHGNFFYDTIIEMMKKYHDLDDKSQIVIQEYFKSAAKAALEREREGD